MTHTELKYRLENLYIDLRCSNEEIIRKLVMFDITGKEREKILRELYDKENIDIKTNDLTRDNNNPDKHDPRIDARIYEKYITGFDDYLKAQQMQIDTLIENNRIAVKLIKYIICLKDKRCDILFFRYFRKMSTKQIMLCMFLSRPTYYGIKRKAINDLLEMYNRNER